MSPENVTIITATYNHEDCILKFLNSIPDATSHPIIISDGGSTDMTIDLMFQWASAVQHPNFTVRETEERLWEGENVRLALEWVNTPRLLKCDPDILLSPDVFKLEEHLDMPDVGAAIPDQNNWGLAWWRQIPHPKSVAVKEIEVLLGTCFIADTEAIFDAGSWRVDYPYGVSEWSVAYNMRINGLKVVLDPSINIVHVHKNLELGGELHDKVLESWDKFGENHNLDTGVKDPRGIPFAWRILPYNKRFYGSN